MSYRADREARLAARRSLQTRPLRSEELSAGAVHDSHVSQKSVSETHLAPSLLFETLAPRPPSQGSVGSEHLESGLEARLRAVEEALALSTQRVAELERRLSEAEATIGGLKSDVRTLKDRSGLL